MENLEKKNNQENDLEAGSVLYIFIRGFRSLRRGLSQLFISLGSLILTFLFFIQKYVIFLVASLIIGYCLGAYITWSKGSKYQSKMAVRVNFGSSRALYNSVEYLNALVAEGKVNELSKLLLIKPAVAANLSSFDIAPVTDELFVTELYKQSFLQNDRKNIIRTDTFWTRTVDYKTFKDNLTKHDYPIQEIVATCTQSDIFPSLERGIMSLVNSNKTLQRNLEISKSTTLQEEKILLSSISGLDTLKDVYNERLRKGSGNSPATTVNVSDRSEKAQFPELELYEKMLLLRDELLASRNASSNKQDIIQVYASFNPVGKRLSVLRQSGFTYAYSLLFITTLVLLLIEIYKWLSQHSKKGKIK